MSRFTVNKRLVLPIGLALAMPACTSEPNPTEPVPTDNHAPAALSFARVSNTWTERAARPFSPLVGISAGVIPNSAGQSIVYVLGGTTPNEGGSGFGISLYNVATNTWTARGTSKVYVFNSNGVGVIGNKLYYSGGYDYSSGFRVIQRLLWAYDPVADQFISKAEIPKATADGVTGVIDGKLYVLPGTCSGDLWPDPRFCEFEPIRQLYRYNPATNTWTARRAAPHFHKSGAAGVIGGKFYVAGGVNSAYLDVYDPATNTWSTLAPMPTAGPAIGAALRAKLFVLSGGKAYVYNPGTNKWKKISAPTWGHDAVVRVQIDGNPYLLAVGGNHGPNFDIPNPSELYTP
jgi:N-acetylneuraminic acid mutarotase